MDVLKAMQAFAETVEQGSFVAASEQLGTSTAAVSRQVAALEAHLGVRLLHRTTRRLSLTEPGQAYFERAVEALRDIAEAEAIAGEHSVQPAGTLRISAPLSFGVKALGRILPDFRRRYPELALDIDLTDRVADLAHEGVDVALRIARSPSPNLIARKIAPVRMALCASPDYLRQRGMPEAPDDLADLEVFNYSYLTSGDRWTFHDGSGRESVVRLRPTVRATNGDLLRDLAIANGGVILQPMFIVAEDLEAGRLVRILADWHFDELDLYAVYLSRTFLPAKVRVFVDFLVSEIGKTEI